MNQAAELFENIYRFLKQHEFLVQHEPLFLYPQSFNQYEAWIDELETFSENELIDFENFKRSPKNPEFKNYMEHIQALAHQITQASINDETLNSHIKRKLTPKKQHEILQISSFLNGKKFDQIYDVGSGAGHLSMLLASKTHQKIINIDINSEFQFYGQEKIKEHLQDLAPFIEYRCEPFQEKTIPLNTQNKLIIGLHSCGDLSIDEINTHTTQSMTSLLNIACCYHKMKNYSPLSPHAITKNFILSNEALHLAAHSELFFDHQMIRDRIRVKPYRYILHFFMKDQLNLEFITLKSAVNSDYELSFGDYAIKMLNKIGISNVHKNALEEYYLNPDNHRKFKRLLSYGIIRSKIGRIVELYILLDRVLYLMSKGHQVIIKEIFDAKISPRNLMIYSEKSK